MGKRAVLLFGIGEWVQEKSCIEKLYHWVWFNCRYSTVDKFIQVYLPSNREEQGPVLSRSQMPRFGVELKVGQRPFRREALLCLVALTPPGSMHTKGLWEAQTGLWCPAVTEVFGAPVPPFLQNFSQTPTLWAVALTCEDPALFLPLCRAASYQWLYGTLESKQPWQINKYISNKCVCTRGISPWCVYLVSFTMMLNQGMYEPQINSSDKILVHTECISHFGGEAPGLEDSPFFWKFALNIDWLNIYGAVTVCQRNIDFDFEELPKSSLFTSYFFIVYDLNWCVEFYIVIFLLGACGQKVQTWRILVGAAVLFCGSGGCNSEAEGLVPAQLVVAPPEPSLDGQTRTGGFLCGGYNPLITWMGHDSAIHFTSQDHKLMSFSGFGPLEDILELQAKAVKHIIHAIIIFDDYFRNWNPNKPFDQEGPERNSELKAMIIHSDSDSPCQCCECKPSEQVHTISERITLSHLSDSFQSFSLRFDVPFPCHALNHSVSIGLSAIPSSSPSNDVLATDVRRTVFPYALAHWQESQLMGLQTDYKGDEIVNKQTTVLSPIASVYHFTFSHSLSYCLSLLLCRYWKSRGFAGGWAVIGDRAVRLVPGLFGNDRIR
ncbi:hypothetical protein MJG53_007576 [Ovis ammon polii x Ovis aries]|uniref:Uncharacterized protein n=1 Tax=Ovis ammon polii x Ovis aries TaxID=2918886 RepID=A0ACB9V314_9CETA|nr:hypothetical protein MJG53_007576 [Ovis ammon polii x Ovis aries]